jgi:hypothetical protein
VADEREREREEGGRERERKRERKRERERERAFRKRPQQRTSSTNEPLSPLAKRSQLKMYQRLWLLRESCSLY